jgi:hypothetical protein
MLVCDGFVCSVLKEYVMAYVFEIRLLDLNQLIGHLAQLGHESVAGLARSLERNFATELHLKDVFQKNLKFC